MKKLQKPEGAWYRLFPSFPVAMVTVECEGKSNIITLAMVHVFSFEPPLIGIGVSPKRHSFSMLKGSREFVLNVPDKELIPQTLYCGVKSGRKLDKFRETGLTPVKAQFVGAPLIGECPVNIECKVVQEIETGDHVWFLGRVEAIHMDEGYDRICAASYWGGEFRMMGELIGKRQ